MKSLTFLGLFACCSIFFLSSVQAQINGQGPTVKQELDLADFHSIGLGLSAEVYLTKGSNHKVVVEGQQNIIDLLKKEVKNGSWNIGFPNNTRVRNYEKLKIYITLPTVEGLAIGGSGKIIAQTPFNDLRNLDISIGGSGTVEFAGSAKEVNISIGGSGNVNAKGLKTENCAVSIGGSGNAYIEAGEKLDVSIAGSGSVYYNGRPRVSSSIAGSGKVQSL